MNFKFTKRIAEKQYKRGVSLLNITYYISIGYNVLFYICKRVYKYAFFNISPLKTFSYVVFYKKACINFNADFLKELKTHYLD